MIESPCDARFSLPFDLYGKPVVAATDVRPGDVVVALPRSRRYVRSARDFLRVSRVTQTGLVFGYRVFPEEWEREQEYTVAAPDWRQTLTRVEAAA